MSSSAVLAASGKNPPDAATRWQPRLVKGVLSMIQTQMMTNSAQSSRFQTVKLYSYDATLLQESQLELQHKRRRRRRERQRRQRTTQKQRTPSSTTTTISMNAPSRSIPIGELEVGNYNNKNDHSDDIDVENDSERQYHPHPHPHQQQHVQQDDENDREFNPSMNSPAIVHISLENVIMSPSFSSTLSQYHHCYRHRFVAFFIVQGNDANHFSKHTLTLRHRLATEYNDDLTTILMQVPGSYDTTRNNNPNTKSNDSLHLDHYNNNNRVYNDNRKMSSASMETTSTTSTLSPWMGPMNMTGSNNSIKKNDEMLLAVGTGFFVMEYEPIVLTLLNVTQLPAVVVIDKHTGRPLDGMNVIPSILWNDSNVVVDAWKKGHSGLSYCQLIWATMTCQNTAACVIS